MADPIKAAFRGAWRLEVQPAEGDRLALVRVLECQAAWAALTEPSRRALLAFGECRSDWVHPATQRALIRHGLLGERGITDAGRAVLRHRPVPSLPDTVGDRHVVDVHLPEETA